MNSKAFTFLSLLFAVVLLTSFMVSAEKNEAADEKANQAADASTQDGGGGHGGGTHGNERGINFLSCTRGCCAWGGGARTFCVKCCSNQEEAQDNTKNEPHA